MFQVWLEIPKFARGVHQARANFGIATLACAEPPRPLERRRSPGDSTMLAIGVILVFIIAVGALNWFEFGSVD
jgi:hypothetical protein